ncbi:hypothetical protein ACFCZQ_02825 [Streptomyces virginiae]|uniref:hypothetical protein n=1 Tax=Streptomyces virginiae TaxID=1961 RepID=UPI0035D8539F
MLSDILGGCLIARDYKPRTFMNEQIKLTPYGHEKMQAFAQKRIPVPEARAICFLEFSWIDLLVDPVATDASKVQQAIGRQIKERSVFFPFVFGRELYDRAHTELDADNRMLDVSATGDFLRNTPQGVFQMHEYVTGPFGLLSSKELRFYPPQRHANLVHCSDLNCHELHEVHFSTAQEAPINKHRREATRILQKDSETPSAWGSFVQSVFTSIVHPSRDNVSETLIPLVGDCLTDDEMRELTVWLLDNTKGALRSICQDLGYVGGAQQITQGMNRAQLMQLCLTMTDRYLIQGIDTLVHGAVIKIPVSEIRTPLINGDTLFGTFRMAAEIGCHGVGIKSKRMPLAPLRLRSLIEKMYRLTDVDDREELDWQLRTASGDTLEARLENYLLERSPTSVVETLVLARKSNAVAACEILGLREGATDSKDFIPLILWKLGYPTAAEGDRHAKFWDHHRELDSMARRAFGGPLAPSAEEFRGATASFFAELENVLDDALAFTVWALTHDHVTDRRPFIFEPERHRLESFELLHSAASKKGDTELAYGDRNALYALCRGFQCLAKELQQIAIDRELHRRPESELPDWVPQQSLQRFPFVHRVPFLDLTNDSRESVLRNLNEVSRILVAEKVYDARNGWLHGGRKELDFDSVRTALPAAERAVKLLEDCGFTRISFAQSKQSRDGYGRTVTTMENARGVRLEMNDPSPFAWLELPSVSGEVHIMTAASFSGPSNFLRFSSETASPYTEMWSEYPKRKPKSQRASHALEGVHATARELPRDSGASGS